jgi:hypothetical protein
MGELLLVRNWERFERADVSHFRTPCTGTTFSGKKDKTAKRVSIADISVDNQTSDL